MDSFEIVGGRSLRGRVAAAGSKNASLPLLAAGLLLDAPARFSGVPALRDVETLLELLARLGLGVARPAPGVAVLEPGDGPTEAPYEVVRRMRASVCVLGPLLARRGAARVSLPGGCVIGERPIDLHLKGMAALGADIRIEHGTVVAKAPPGGLRGARMFLAAGSGPTVLGTANVMMAACLAKGGTVIESAAAEPELAELAAFLNACGAKIRGAGTHCVEIEGVASLGGTEWTMPPDRIEVGTLLLAGAATRGDVEVEGCRPDEIAVLLDLFQRAGVPFEERRDPSGGGSVRVLPWERPPRVLDVSTRPYPGFPTDLQAQWMAFCTIGEGLAVITDRVYPDRFMHVPELNRLGASVRREGPTALVVGPAALSGAPITASDLRASAGLVIAGLVAEGMTTVRRVYHLDRGYEALETKLRALGGDVRRVVDEAGP